MKAHGSVSGLPRLSEPGDIGTETVTIQFRSMPPRQAARGVKTASHVPSTGLAACVGLSYSALRAFTGLTDEAR
jgi:hypothetical protein